jgi:hypothetical protein
VQKPNADRPWPGVNKLLVERLEEVFPDRSPTMDMSDRQIWMAVGAIAVIKKLRQVHQQQATSVLSSTS